MVTVYWELNFSVVGLIILHNAWLNIICGLECRFPTRKHFRQQREPYSSQCNFCESRGSHCITLDHGVLNLNSVWEIATRGEDSWLNLTHQIHIRWPRFSQHAAVMSEQRLLLCLQWLKNWLWCTFNLQTLLGCLNLFLSETSQKLSSGQMLKNEYILNSL